MTGLAAITEFYPGFVADMADSEHFWTRVLDECTLKYHWVQAQRATDGRLLAIGGIEYATVDGQGLIST